MTLTKFMARSTWVAHAFEWEKLLKCHLKGKASKKLSNGQNIDYSEKRKRPKGFICPCTGVKYHNIQTCLLVYAADSGERLQDHWSSGFTIFYKFIQCVLGWGVGGGWGKGVSLNKMHFKLCRVTGKNPGSISLSRHD